MSIGRGWYPEKLTDEFEEVAKALLKGKIADIFAISQRKHEESLTKEKENGKNICTV